MYGIDPPSPILRIVSSTTSTQRLAYTINRLHAEHQAQLAQADPIAVRHHATQPTALTDRQHMARIAQADPIAVHHSVGATILRLRTLAETDGGFAQRIAEL